MRAYSFNLILKFSQHGDFGPKYCIFLTKLPTKNLYKLKFAGDAAARLLPPVITLS